MTTPERPSLADTLARIEAILAEPVAKPPCLHCARQALLGSPYCAAHKRIPREMIEDLGPVEPGLRSVAEASAALLGRERPPARPLVLIPPARPGWLARALHGLFGGAS